MKPKLRYETKYSTNHIKVSCCTMRLSLDFFACVWGKDLDVFLFSKLHCLNTEYGQPPRYTSFQKCIAMSRYNMIGENSQQYN